MLGHILMKGADLYGRNRTCRIVILLALWISLRVGFFVSLFAVCFTYLLPDFGK